MRTLVKLLVVVLPWPLKRRLLRLIWGYQLHPTARIGLAWVFPQQLTMGPHAHIDHFTVCKGMDAVEIGEKAYIGRLNWISGFPRGHQQHFAHLPERDPRLRLGAHASVTNRHLIDCTDRVEIGPYTTLAGSGSQILTHAIDLQANRQHAAPVAIGSYCMIGTASVILSGARLPDRCVLGAKSLLNRAWDACDRLYAGVPAREVRALADGAYFTRSEGFVI